MPRIVKNKDAVDKIEKGSAKYKDGERLGIVKTHSLPTGDIMDALVIIQKQINLLNERKPDTNNEILAMLNIVVSNIAAYHLQMTDSINKLDAKPVMDMSKMAAIIQKLNGIMVMLEARSKREWIFDVDRDMTDKMLRVRAKQVTH